MIAVEAARDLFRQMQWADAAVWRAVVAKPEAAADERVLALLLHLHVVQRAFLYMWRREAFDPAALYAKKDAPALMRWAREYYSEAEDFIADAEPRLHELVEMPWLAYFEQQLGRSLQAPTLGETFVQVPMHSMYHRGQVNTRIREVGGEPAAVDFINWIWLGKPDPEW